MKLLVKTKKCFIHVKDERTIIKSGKLGKFEHLIQKKAYELGVAPEIYKLNYGNNSNEIVSIEMEYIKGSTIEEYVKNNRENKAQIKNLVIEAQNILFNNGIDHRDFTGKNIMITEDNKVKIIDYGNSILHSGPIPHKMRQYYYFN